MVLPHFTNYFIAFGHMLSVTERNENLLFCKSAHVTFVITLFSCDHSLKICRTYRDYCLCRSPLCRLLQTCFCFCAEDEKWVTCLNYPFAGLHASVPRNCITWETSAKETQRRFWRMEVGAEQGRAQRNGRSDATTAREPRPSPCTSLKVHKLT